MFISKHDEKDIKYFIKDESLNNTDHDEFNHRDISNILCNIIDTTNPPFNIAIIGKWGLGKSSLINMALNKYRNQSDKFCIQEINAWKYEKEALTKVFLKQLWEGIEGTKVKSFEKIKKRYIEIINSIRTTTPDKDKKNSICKTIKTCSIVTVLSIVAFLSYKIIQALVYNINMNNLDFWLTVFLSYCRNIAITLLLPILTIVANLYLVEILSGNKRSIAFNIDVQSSDEYEMLLEDKIKEKLAQNKDYTIITVIDDLDRLSINKIVEALDAIKAFVGFNRCIFIVPFDDAILKKALEKRKINGLQSDNEIIESELILDKLFQYKIYLPPILKYDIKEYAIKLISEKAPDFLSDYCNINVVRDLIRTILIHSGVTTPRQVKKIINIFITNYMIAFNRELLHKVEEGNFTDDSAIKQIGIISVLQADFNEFYDLLFYNFNYIDLILKYYKDKIPIKDIDENLKHYFEIFENNQGEETRIKPENMELINYLHWVIKYKEDNFYQYMYLAQEEISKKTGDENYRRFINALESNNTILVSEMLETDNNSYCEILRYKLESTYDYEIPSIIESSINIFNYINKQHRRNIASIITSKVQEVKPTNANINYEKLNVNNVVDLFKCSEHLNFNLLLISDCIKALINTNNTETKTLSEAIRVLINNNNIFNNDIILLIEKLCNKFINLTYIDIHEIVSVSEDYYNKEYLLNKYFGMSFFERIIHELDENNSFEESIFKAFKTIFKSLLVNNDINFMIEKIEGLFKYPSLVDVLNEVLVADNCQDIDNQKATTIAEQIITLDYNGDIPDSALKLLSKLSYQLSDNNAQTFDKFISETLGNSIVNPILIYNGKSNHFRYLDQSIIKLMNNVFTTADYDGTFEQVQQFFTETQKGKLKSLLITSSRHNKYKSITVNRLINIYKLIYKDKENNDLINQSVQDVINQFNSQNNDREYYKFVSELIGYLHKDIEADIIKSYLNTIIRVFTNNIDISVEAISKIQSVISDDIWDSIMSLLIKNVSSSNYKLIFNIIEDNKKYFNSNKGNLGVYVDFLINTMDISDDPNKNLLSINKKYNKISKTNELIEKCSLNDNVSYDLALQVIVKLLSNLDLDEISNIFVECSAKKEIFDYCSSMFLNIKKHPISRIMNKVSINLKNTQSLNSIYNLLDFSIKNKSKIECSTVINISSIALSSFDEPSVIDKICYYLSQFGKDYFTDSKDDLAKKIYERFTITGSEQIKGNLLRIVSELKIRRQFKKLLKEEEIKYYNNNIK